MGAKCGKALSAELEWGRVFSRFSPPSPLTRRRQRQVPKKDLHARCQIKRPWKAPGPAT